MTQLALLAGAVPLSIKKFEAWYRGRGALPHNDGYVYFATVSGPTANRRPVGVDHIGLSRCRVDSRGRRTESLIQEDMNSALRAFWTEAENLGPSVVDARKKFATAKHRWKPSDADVAAMRAAVNRKARKVIL